MVNGKVNASLPITVSNLPLFLMRLPWLTVPSNHPASKSHPHPVPDFQCNLVTCRITPDAVRISFDVTVLLSLKVMRERHNRKEKLFMVACPECETDLDVDADLVEEGEIVSCPECGSDFEVITAEPLELSKVEEGYEDDEEEEEEEEEDE
jgi:alpha-aminoadipate carrier protein LysW